ncbi:hypothetical protein BDN70DRAFT_930186 [Pholiota conissans]|uniref:BZIP domain-containing protein n=1 Tax=Pholiota conissans TaxID=109636 RepID=A0A9P5Z8L0_9AGAR|nr:hypothetical protein BDN70DRAFT_930186 [Pholiota conissans]
MPAPNLQGLNIVHPVQEHDNSNDLLLGQAYPDLTAQLDLWTNLAFESEEPLAARHHEHKKTLPDEDEDEVRSPVTGEKAIHDGHVNVVTPANVANLPNNTAANNLFDINSFLANFGIDAYNTAPHMLHQQAQQPALAPSLAQLLAMQPNHGMPYAGQGMPHFLPPAPPQPTFTAPSSASTASDDTRAAPAKRARTRKMSVTSAESPDFREDSLPPNTSLSPAEDKRRRNTAASARFRLKKKEREAALEGKAKELESKVAELERECEGLRRENGWLKGLVVGVTGAAQGPNNGQGLTVPSPPPPAPVSTGSKRRREEGQTA